MGLRDSYHKPASPTHVKQKHWTLITSWNAFVSIQSFILRRFASTSSSGLPASSGLKCDQFNCGIWAGSIGCAGIGCAGGMCSCTGGMGGWYWWYWSRWHLLHLFILCVVKVFILILTFMFT